MKFQIRAPEEVDTREFIIFYHKGSRKRRERVSICQGLIVVCVCVLGENQLGNGYRNCDI